MVLVFSILRDKDVQHRHKSIDTYENTKEKFLTAGLNNTIVLVNEDYEGCVIKNGECTDFSGNDELHVLFDYTIADIIDMGWQNEWGVSNLNESVSIADIKPEYGDIPFKTMEVLLKAIKYFINPEAYSVLSVGEKFVVTNMKRANALVDAGATLLGDGKKVLQKGMKSLNESEKEKPYHTYFRKKMEKYQIESPSELSDDEKKKFFDEVDKDWTGQQQKK